MKKEKYIYLCSLDVADLDRGSNSKAWIERLHKRGMKPVQECHGVAYAVKCQHSCSVVQVHTYPGGVGGVDGSVHSVVPGGVTSVGAEEAPGFIVVAQQAQWAFALSADALVGNSDGEFPAPLDLPVEATSGQGFPTQHLGEAVEPLRGFTVRLQVPGADDFSVAFRDVQLLVGSVRVQFQLAEVWSGRIHTLFWDGSDF